MGNIIETNLKNISPRHFCGINLSMKKKRVANNLLLVTLLLLFFLKAEVLDVYCLLLGNTLLH